MSESSGAILEPFAGAEKTFASSQTPTNARYRVMAFLCALSFLTYFDRVCIVRAQQHIQTDLSLTDTQMGWILGVFWFAYGMFEIPGGWMGDRYGTRITLVRIVLAWSLFTALSGSAVGFLSLLTCRLLFGMGEAGAFPNMAAIQARWVPTNQRARFGGMLWLCARWGGAFSPIIFGILLRSVSSDGFREFVQSVPGLGWLSAVQAWRIGFWMAGFLGILWCISFYPWFRNTPAESPSVNAAERALLPAPSVADSHAASKQVWRALFTSGSLWALAILYFCGSFGWSFFVSWMPRYMKDTYNVKFENSEWMSAMPLFLGGISCLVGGSLCDYLVTRYGRKRFIRACFPVTGCLIASAAMFGIRYVETVQQATILMCLAAAAYDMGQSANWASIVDIGGRHAGLATGFINMIGNMGHFAQPVIGAYVFNTFGWNAVFILYSMAFLTAASMWIFINPEKKYDSECGADNVHA